MPSQEPQISDISIIVAARNEDVYLGKCIESLLIAAQGKAEILLVDDGSNDNSLGILKSFGSKIKWIEGTGEGPGKARNLGMQASQKTFFAFTDADCVVSSDWLEVLARSIQGQPSNISSVGGVQKISRDANAFEKSVGEFFGIVGFVSDYVHTDGATRKVLHNPTCNVLYSKEALTKAQGFDENLWPCEDLDLDLRLRKLGFDALFNPEAVVEHRRPNTWLKLTQMMKRYGFGHAQLVKKHGVCQKVHVLVFLPVLPFLFIWKYQLSLLLFFPLFLFGLKTKKIKKSIQFTFMLLSSITLWVLGFYSGLWGSSRVAKHV